MRTAKDFTDQPGISDGASDRLVGVFDQATRHARTATGVAQPLSGAVVQIEAIPGLCPARYRPLWPDPRLKSGNPPASR